jgi:hypothetical protein
METLAYLQAVQDENTERKLSGKMAGVMLGAAGAALAVGVAQAPAHAYGWGGGSGCFERCEPVFLGGGYQVTSYRTYDVSFKGGYDKGCYSDCGYSQPVSYGCYDHCGISYPSSGGCYDDCGYGYGGHEISYDYGHGGCYDDCGSGGYGGGYGVSYDYGHGGCYDDCGYGGGYGVSYDYGHGGCYDYCGVSYGGYSTYDIQSALSYAGFHVAVDGVYGPETHHAVVAFQLAVGLVPDGIVGPATASALGLY